MTMLWIKSWRWCDCGGWFQVMTDDSDIDYTDDDDDDHQLNPQWKTLKKLEKSYRNIKKGNEIEKRFSPNCSEAWRSSLGPPPIGRHRTYWWWWWWWQWWWQRGRWWQWHRWWKVHQTANLVAGYCPPAHQGSPLVHNVLFASNPNLSFIRLYFSFHSKPFFYSFVLLFSTSNLAIWVELENIVLRTILNSFFLSTSDLLFLHSQFCPKTPPAYQFFFFLIHWLSDVWVAESCGNK